MRDRVDVVVALGGDGTINEVVNGVLTDGLHKHVPAVGVVPAGSTNVFARALGLPNDPIEATGVLLEALTAGRRREISLGRADDRWFLFAAGMGFDAAVVAAVEKARRQGHPVHPHALRALRRAPVRFSAVRGTPTRSPCPATRTAPKQDRPADGDRHQRQPVDVPGQSSPHADAARASFDNGLSIYARRNMGLFSLDQRRCSPDRHARKPRPVGE